MRTQIKEITSNRIRVQYVDWLDQIIDMTIGAPSDGGYVYQILADGSTTQVCDKLASTGSTLIYSPKYHGRLIDLIRREYRKGRRAEKALAEKV